MSLKRILRYLQGMKDYSLFIYGSNDLVLSAHCDADWARDLQDRRSTTGVLLQVGKSVIAWKTVKQSSVALSTTEAEFVALSEGEKLILWILCLLNELGCGQETTIVLEDNQDALI